MTVARNCQYGRLAVFKRQVAFRRARALFFRALPSAKNWVGGFPESRSLSLPRSWGVAVPAKGLIGCINKRLPARVEQDARTHAVHPLDRLGLPQRAAAICEGAYMPARPRALVLCSMAKGAIVGRARLGWNPRF
jgi:hypothetical protein